MARRARSRPKPLLRRVSLLLAGGSPVVFALVLKPWLQQALGEPSWWLVLLMLVAWASVFLTVLLTTRQVSVSGPSTPQRLEVTAQRFPHIRTIRRLLRLTSRSLVRCFGASHATIFLEEPSTSTYWLTERYGSALPTSIQQLNRTSPLIQWLDEFRKPLQHQDCLPSAQRNGQGHAPDPYARLHLIMENLRAEVIVPSFRGRRLLGFVVLGDRNDKRVYTEVEVTALARLARDCAVALDNARRYEEWEATAHKLQSAQGRLLQQERMVAAGKLAMGLAHEIKNPLAGIKTFTEFLPERYNDPTFREDFFDVVGKEVDRINRIVSSLADFAKPILLKIETIDVQRVLKETVTLLSNDCLKRNVTLHQSFEPQPILLPGDASQLKQAFLNLCTNALEAMPKGGTLSVNCQLKEGEAVIGISDTGVGIAQEHLPNLFDPFFTTKDSGMGLGLAVVKQIVEQHLGTVQVESEVGGGTTFEIRLPLAVRFKAIHPLVNDGTERSIPNDAVVSLDLLVVDDEPKLQAVLKDVFEVLGSRVRVAASGEDALELIARKMPQLVLLDLKLQDMDGFAVLKHLKLRYPALPIIVITGTFDESIDRYVKSLGALACFHKPIDLPILQHKLAEVAVQLTAQPTSSPTAV